MDILYVLSPFLPFSLIELGFDSGDNIVCAMMESDQAPENYIIS